MINSKNIPLIVEIYTDNGEHSHFKLIDIETGKILWEENEESNLEELVKDFEEKVINMCTKFWNYYERENYKKYFHEVVLAGICLRDEPLQLIVALEKEIEILLKFVKEMNELGKLNPDRLCEYSDIIYHKSLKILNKE